MRSKKGTGVFLGGKILTHFLWGNTRAEVIIKGDNSK
jgi:hypothetical protein